MSDQSLAPAVPPGQVWSQAGIAAIVGDLLGALAFALLVLVDSLWDALKN